MLGLTLTAIEKFELKLKKQIRKTAEEKVGLKSEIGNTIVR